MKTLLKYCFMALVLLVMGAQMNLQAEVRRHVVQPGQTLYSISKAYGVTVEAIQEANPTLEGVSLAAGMTLVIPEATTAPVPMPLVPEVVVPEGDGQAMQLPLTQWNMAGDHWNDGVLNLALIMPFNLHAESAAESNTQMRSVEFYQGALMAVDEMQQTGRRVVVQAYDLGTESIYSILANPELTQADLVIAPMQEEEVRPVAEWAETHATPVVSSFVFDESMLRQCSNLFQLNSPKAMLYQQLSDELTERFKDYTFVFLTDSVSGMKVDPYPSHLKQELSRRHIPYRELSYLSPTRLMACDSILGLKDENLMFVPVTPQPDAMRRMFSGLQHVKILREARLAEAQSNTNGGSRSINMPQIAILGYPEWTRQISEFINYYYELNVYMFTKVYANPLDPKLDEFYSTFKSWYGKEPMSNLVPKYGLLGYDVTRYFLQQLARNGRRLLEMGEEPTWDGMQNVFSFARSDGHGYYNRGFYLVHFTNESTIEKIVVQ